MHAYTLATEPPLELLNASAMPLPHQVMSSEQGMLALHGFSGLEWHETSSG